MAHSLHISANTCKEFINTVIASAEKEKKIFQNNKIWDTEKFTEVFRETACNGINYEIWADYRELLAWCFYDISIKDAIYISNLWIIFLSTKL